MCSLLFLVDLLFFFLCKERNAAVTILFGSFCCCILCLLALASLSFAGWQERHSFCLLAWLGLPCFFVWGENLPVLGRALYLPRDTQKHLVCLRERKAAMPLVMLCGFPCSGKSRRAQELRAYLESKGKQVVVVGDESEGIDTRTAYLTPKIEKQTRGIIKSAVDRALAKDTVVIVDSLNYIKGYRYELYCLARATETPHCVIHTLERDADCIARHEERESPYGQDNATKLIMRFEPPNAHQRWDRPTFALTADEPLPCADILQCLFEPGKTVKAHQATQSQPLSETNFLFELDRITQAIVSAVLKEMATAVIGDQLAVPETDAKLTVKRKYTMSELRRIRQAVSHSVKRE